MAGIFKQRLFAVSKAVLDQMLLIYLQALTMASSLWAKQLLVKRQFDLHKSGCSALNKLRCSLVSIHEAMHGMDGDTIMPKLADSKYVDSDASCHCGDPGAYLRKVHEQETRCVEERGGKDSTKWAGC